MLKSIVTTVTTVALSLGLGLAGCVTDPAELGADEAAISGNLTFTTYYDCHTDELVGELSAGCYPGGTSLVGRKTLCYETESESCATHDLVEDKYCAVGKCDLESYLNELYVDWLDKMREAGEVP